MVGKGRRRREKNYRAAHGGHHSVLPPPPKPSQVDALPSKLRHIMSFSSKPPNPTFDKDKRADRKRPREESIKGDESSDREHFVTSETVNLSGDTSPGNVNEEEETKKKKKRKRSQVDDLRFVAELNKTRGSEKRKERKKKYLEAKKKKHKKSSSTGEDNLDFPGREKIKFGDVVQAPPKLTSVPKKHAHDASQERLRLQAIEAYRKRRGWGSRPGLQLPSVMAPPPLM
ncbi:hypothetical protein Tsubulata_003359 [Turnera subulata]|uniref:Uncharacterized protein n=1 Tax=Turnera subulata TaxID=218843 RepID=A0A9Q0JNP7_9ROSI|nr:hypothetical protein Tsubulata_003359 [Turnera subulata]